MLELRKTALRALPTAACLRMPAWSYKLVRIQLNTHAHSCQQKGPDLVEVEAFTGKRHAGRGPVTS